MPTALEIRDQIGRGTLTAQDAARLALDRIAAAAPLNACITIPSAAALARAESVDAADASTLPLAGVPVAVKDNICTRGIRTTAGSRTLEDYVPPYSASVIERLEAAGAVVVAKTNCDEFAMGSSTEHSAFGPAHNPWDAKRTAGGSSGGSAVLVARRAVPLALGSETGGSVRQPAGLCGVMGLKPTYGRISRYGLLAFASSLDQVGLFATTASDLAAGLQVLAGPDPRDATSAPTPPPGYAAALNGGLRGMRIGVPRALLADGLEPGVAAAFEASLDVCRSLGATVHDIALPHATYATATYAIVVMAEASSNLARYDGVRYGSRVDAGSLEEMYMRTRARFGAEVTRRILLGTFVLSAGYYDAYYRKAQQVRRLILRDYEEAFDTVHIVATPTSPTTAFELGARVEDPVQMYLADVFTASANLAGIPAISVPCGFSAGLPVGLQFTGPAWGEDRLLGAAAGYERATPWSAMQPPD